MKRKIQIRRGAAADRPTLASGEFGLDTDTGSEAVFIGTPNSGNLQLALSTNVNIYSHLPYAYESGFGSSVTRYIVPAYYNVSSTSADMRYYFNSAAVIQSFTITGRPGTAPAQNYTHTFTLRVNGSDTAMVGSITVTQAGGSSTYYTVTTTADAITVAGGSWIDIKCVMDGNTFIKVTGNILIKL